MQLIDPKNIITLDYADGLNKLSKNPVLDVRVATLLGIHTRILLFPDWSVIDRSN